MKKIQLIPSNRAIGLFPIHPLTGKPALDMDLTQLQMPLHIGQTFTFEGQSLKITALEEQQSPSGDANVLMWVDLM